MRKFAIILLLSTFFTLSLTTILKAEDSSAQNQQKSDLEQKIQSYQKKLEELRQQRSTLSSQIQYMDTQVYLTGLKIEETIKKIEETEKEINLLSTRIDGLDSSLDHLSQTLLERVVDSYKKHSLSVLDLMLDSKNANMLVSNLKYYEAAQHNNERLLLQVQQTKSNFEEQKKLRENKKTDLDKLQVTLTAQQKDLVKQQDSKRRLLTVTQNDETTYQRLLSQAKQQLASFSSFVQSSGAGNTIGANAFGTGSDGAYYSQRDSRWAYNTIGDSSENILNVGCLLSSISMFAKKNGQNITPADLAADASRFFGSTALMNNPWPGVAGKSYTPISDIDAELSRGNYVITGVKIQNCAFGGNHFVLLTKKEGDDYIMHDPVYGPDKKFSTYYSTICSSATFR